LNVGAGAGSYEPPDLAVTAIDPSREMLAQRPEGAADAHQGVAEALPFEDNAFDAAMAVLTVHHWDDATRGLSEMSRVSRGPIAILTYDPSFRGFWLTDYLPELLALDEGQMPPMSLYERCLGPVDVESVPIPANCTDGFLCAYWRRPGAYLDPRIRRGISSFWKLGDTTAALERLKQDLDSGAWNERYGHLLDRDELDLGYRLVIRPGAPLQ
ncbi:MAG: class I SAM-dependent methyltransferase, partial [Myxococcota bacterium]